MQRCSTSVRNRKIKRSLEGPCVPSFRQKQKRPWFLIAQIIGTVHPPDDESPHSLAWTDRVATKKKDHVVLSGNGNFGNFKYSEVDVNYCKNRSAFISKRLMQPKIQMEPNFLLEEVRS